MRNPTVAVIGGSGFYSFLDSPEQLAIATPYGEPSAPVALGAVSGRPVAFLPRHGARHELPPHLINYRANLWALRSVGVRQVLAPCAVGALQHATGPGAVVVPDQLVDQTRGRVQTYVERGAAHAPFADPYCPVLRAALIEADPCAVDGGTMVVIDGPRFSTRAESRWYAAQGWSLVNMTGHPEAVLARELGLCYATIALVTDNDAGVGHDDAVDQATVLAVMSQNIDRVKGLITRTVAALPGAVRDCACGAWLEGLDLPFALP